ncbi:hypothetical protein J7K93_02295 [bacterium]|nr:hypothetical protein [bacterium]
MPCPSENTILRFITDEMRAEEKKKISDHISQCQKCRNIVQGYRGLNKLMLQRSVPEVPEKFQRLVIKQFSGQHHAGTGYRILNSWIRKSAAFAVILLIFFAGIQTGRSIYSRKKGEYTLTPIAPSVDSYLVSTQTLLLDYSNLNSNSFSMDEQNDLTIKTAEKILGKTKVIKSLITDDNRDLISLISEIENLLEEMIQSKETDSKDLENLVKQELANSRILLRISRYTS